MFTLYLLNIQIFFNDISRFLHFLTVYFDHKVKQLLFIDKLFHNMGFAKSQPHPPF